MRKMFRVLERSQVKPAVAAVVVLGLLVMLGPAILRIAQEGLAWSADLVAQVESGLRSWGAARIGVL